MPNVLLSGPAGAGKSQVAREERLRSAEPAVIADFQSLYAALSGDVRGPDGRYPLRDERLLPITEGLRLTVIAFAVQRGLRVIATNSDGDADRRADLLRRLGPDSRERIADPGRDVVTARLADPATGDLSPECDQAIGRWYDRL